MKCQSVAEAGTPDRGEQWRTIQKGCHLKRVWSMSWTRRFYEGAPAFGFTNGVVNITLSANRTTVGPNGVAINEQFVVAYLRGNLLAAQSLQDAIDKAILLGTAKGDQAN